jgi:mercuric ion transport protein
MRMRIQIEKLGTVGAVIAALACPICFPKLALIGAALGLGIFAPYEGYIAIGVQALFLLALIGQLVAYRAHRNRWLVGLSICTTGLLFIAYYVVPSSVLLQIALAGLVGASVWQVVEMKRCAKCETRMPATSFANKPDTLR